ncbi:MAG: diguanylate cyclase [Planctomycetaceae bacterium]
MHGWIQVQFLFWGALGAAVFAPIVSALISLRERRRFNERIKALEEVLRRMRTADPGDQFGDGAGETSLQLSRERLILQNMLDRFPEITQKFVLVETIPELSTVLLSSFNRVLGTVQGVVFVREGNQLALTARAGLKEEDCPTNLVLDLGAGRIGYAAEKCLIMRSSDFTALEQKGQPFQSPTQDVSREFDLYVPMVHRGVAIGLVAVGGMRRVVQKAHSVSMAVANLGSLVLTNILRAKEIRVLSEEDPLTGLSNRRHCYELLGERLKTRATQPFALFLFDIDHFKRINDQFGHAVGDSVLRKVAEAAKALVRPQDREFACRFGGEEFLCILNCSDVPALSARLESFRQVLAGIEVEAGSGGVRLSGGVAFCPAEHDDTDSLIGLADNRLYAAKDAGRDRIVIESQLTGVRR